MRYGLFETCFKKLKGLLHKRIPEPRALPRLSSGRTVLRNSVLRKFLCKRKDMPHWGPMDRTDLLLKSGNLEHEGGHSHVSKIVCIA